MKPVTGRVTASVIEMGIGRLREPYSGMRTQELLQCSPSPATGAEGLRRVDSIRAGGGASRWRIGGLIPLRRDSACTLPVVTQ